MCPHLLPEQGRPSGTNVVSMAETKRRTEEARRDRQRDMGFARFLAGVTVPHFPHFLVLASLIDVERAFSSDGLTIIDRRHSLNPETSSAVLTVGSWIKHG